MGRGTLPEVRDGSREPPVVLGWVGDPPGGLGWVGRSSVRSETGQGTLPEVRDGSEDAPGGL